MVRYGFEPTIDEQTTAQLVDQYKNDPNQFDYTQSELIREHAEHYKMSSPDTSLGENSFGSLMSQAGKGWIAGFTTLNIDHGEADKQPRTSYERIARSLGHLGGFIGYVPGLRVLSKLGMASKLSTNLMKLRGHSVPLMVGKWATGGIKKTAIGLSKKGINKKGEAVNTVEQFMNTVPGDMMEGAVNLGIASGVSAWQEGIHAVADATLGGGIAGAGFRAIGNLIRVPGAKPIIPGTKLKDLTSEQVNEKVLKGIAGSLMMGLPATLRGATTEEQIYDYLLGAFFGQGEQYIKNRRAIEHLHKMKTQYKDPETGARGTASPELVEGWETMDPKTKDLVKEITTRDAEQGGVISYILARDQLGRMKELQEAETKAKEIYEGEPVERIRKPEEELTESREGKGTDGENSPELIDSSQSYEALFTKSKHYVQRFLEDQWKEAPEPQTAMEDTWRLINRKWNQVVGENIQAGSTENPAVNMIKWVNKRFKKNIVESPEDPEWSFWVKWGNARIHNKPVQVASIVMDMNPARERARKVKDDDIEIDYNPDVRLNILNPNLEPDAVNLAGNAKQLREPVKNIEEAYQREYYERHGVEIDPKTEPVYAIVQDITTNKKSKGKYYQEQTFADWRRDLIKEVEGKSNILDKEWGKWDHLKGKKKREAINKWMEKEVETQYNNVMATITKQMAESGYMYLGGKGDAERLYFVKEHPKLQSRMKFLDGTKRRKPNAVVKEFLEMMKSKHPESVKLYQREKELFQKAFATNSSMSKFQKANTLNKAQAGRLFDRSYLNNILYDLSQNGLPFSRAGLATLENLNVNTAKAYNKRSQIWHTNGIPSDPNYVNQFVSDATGHRLLPEGIRYVLTKDVNKKTHAGSKAEDYVHTMDGEIITLPEIVDALNAGQGLPYGDKSGGVNKSFIVSPDAQFGALLGKYQFKAAPEAQAEAMRRAKIEMIIPESSAKQYGERDIWDKWEWTGRGIRLVGPTGQNARHRYTLPVKDIKVVASEITSDKFIKPQRLPKQMQSNLTPFGFNPIKQRVIDGIFERASVESFNGTKEQNTLAEVLLKNPGDTKTEAQLLSNIEDIGVRQLLDLINSPAHESFATKAYNKILRINDQIVGELQAEGEMSAQDAHSLKLDSMEWQSVFDRIVQLKPDSLVPLLHKVGDSYRQSVMRNYILSQIVKPRLRNSATSRMTGYDEYLQKKLPELNENDSIFYLDEGFRDLKIHMDDGNVLKLGYIWEQLQRPRINSEVKKRFEDVLEAVVVRVPMDSLSGAHKLQFKGFTGRKGFGSVLHPRTMEALGGADLDGDKASIFFGGEKNGFKKEWREAYGSQKEEYYIKGEKKFNFENIEIPSKSSLNEGPNGEVSRVMTPEKKKKALEGSFAERVDWINEEVREFYSTIRTGDLAKARDEALDVMRATYRLEVEPKKKDLKQVLMSLIDSDGKVFSKDVFDAHKKKIIERVGEQEFNKVRGWNYQAVARKARKLAKESKETITTIAHNKPKDMKELLTSQDYELLDRIKTPPLRWSPLLRYEASTGAHVGRNMLGPSVVNRSSILAAYNQVRSSLEFNNMDTYFKLDRWGNIKFELTPITSEEGLKKFRKIARATVAFASDPMDEAGLKGTDVFFNAIFDSLFKMKTHHSARDGRKWTKDNEALTTQERKQAFVGIMSGINSASFGRNLETGKAHNVFDFLQAVNRIKDVPKGPSERTDLSFNGKVAELTKNLDFSDSLLHRMDRAKIDNWYSNVQETLSKADYQEIMGLLGRGSMTIPKNRPLDIVQKYDLFNVDSRKEFIFNEGFGELLARHPDYFFNEYKRMHREPDIFSELPRVNDRVDKAMRKMGEKGVKFGLHEKKKVGRRIQWTLFGKPHNKITKGDIIALAGGPEGLPINGKKKVLENIIKLAGDSISNDMGDWASARLLKEVWNKDVIPPEQFAEYAKVVDAIQRLKSKQDRERDALEPLKDLELDDKTKRMILELDRTIEGQTTTREMDQRQIDDAISKYKDGMTRAESDLFDAMLISSWKRGDPDTVARLQNAKKKIDNSKKSYGYKSYMALQRYLDTKSRQLHNTQFNRVGFASKEVGDHIIKRQLDLMEQAYEQFRYEDSGRDTRVAKQITKNLEAENKKQPLFDEAGKRTEGLAINQHDYSKKTQKYLEDYAPFSKLEQHKDVIVSSKAKKVMNEIISNMDYYGPQTRENLHLIVRDMINKDINTMTLEDWEVVNNIFRDHREGTWFQKTFAKVEGEFPKLAKRFYRMFPEAVDRDIMRHEINWNTVDTIYKDRHGNWITGKGKTAQGWMGELQRNIHLSQEVATMENQREEREWGNLSEPYMTTELGRDLWDFAAMKFESDYMPKRLREKGLTGDKLNEEYARNYERRTAEMAEKIDWENTQSRLLTLTSGVRKPARELVKEIHQLLALKNFENHQKLVGDQKVWKEFVEKKKGELEFYTTVDAEGNVVNTDIPVVSRKKMIKWVTDHFVNNKPFPIEKLGMDGQRKIILGMQMGQIREAERIAGDKNPIRKVLLGGLSEKLSNKKINFDTGMLGELRTVGDKPGIYGYFPHVAKHFEKGIMMGDLTKKIEIIWQSNRPIAEKKQMIAKLYMKSKQLSGDFVEADIVNETWEHITDAIIKKQQGKKTDEEIKWFDNLQRIGNQFSRENHIEGWSTAPEAYLDYTQSITKTFYRNLGQILSRETINEFAKQHKDMPTDLRTSWMNYFKLYAQQSLGFPAIIPKEMFDNDKMKIKGTLYGSLADNRVATRFDQIGRKLGLVGKGKGLPPELKSLDKVNAQAVINLGNMEAKYALATLLAHPKSSIGNYLGGSQMTIVNAGFNNFIKAKKLDYLRKTIDPEFKSWEDVNRWVRELGIIEEFIIREIGANPQLTGANWQAFLKDFKRAVRKDPDLPDISFRDLMKKHNLGKGMMDVAGKFMSLPERALRRDSFIAHYIQARDKLGGRVLPKDHPYLIEMGKKGVKATQFLYSVPFRPMFSGTAMGKVVSRFQLWAWNSVRYRNTIIREAAIRGIRQGSPEFDRFKRLMIADTLSLALGSMFMYSLFGSQMPQPYAWFQDLGDWLFGNEEERDRAFFGAYPGKLAPLQLITPPSFRLTGPILNGLVNDDWEKMANYYTWTMFPFGRLARDLVGPGGLTENPYYGLDKLTGLPIVGAKRISTKRKKEEEKGTEFWTPPGMKASNYFGGTEEA